MEASEVTVGGELRGNVLAAKSTTLSAGAQVNGTIRAPKISIADGAHFEGEIDMEVELPDDLTLASAPLEP